MQVKFLIVAISYFTKWIEADPVAAITGERVKKLYWRIVCHFGIPRVFVSDNDTQFASKVVAQFCQGLHIQQVFASVEHPQTNGLAEAANKVILMGLKKRLEAAKGRWVEELPQVLWSYHTTPHSTTNETLFKLVHGTDVVIPVEVGEPNIHTEAFATDVNAADLRVNLDLLDEMREMAHLKEVAGKQHAARRYNTKVVPRSMKVGDLVLKRAMKLPTDGKLGPNWDGPYRICTVVGKGSYQLKELSGRPVPRNWNVVNLRFYYS